MSTGTNDQEFGEQGAFVSANVEESFAYKPAGESAVLTTAHLKDEKGRVIVGMQFYSNSKKGITDSQGAFEFVWGEALTFGLDTFEFGRVKGNQLEYRLTDVTENEMIKQNIQHIVERYATNHHDNRVEFEQDVHDVFGLYPNVVNEAINLALPNVAPLLDDKGQATGFSTPNEFSGQFNQGIAALIDVE